MGDSASSESIYRWLEQVECARGAGRKEPSRALPQPSMSKPKHKEQLHNQPSATHLNGHAQHLSAREIRKDQQALEIPPKRKEGPTTRSRQGLQPEYQATEGGKRKRLATEDDTQAEGEPFSYPTTITKASKTTRQQLWLLHDATPSVICQPFGSKRPKPNAVMDLMRVLAESRDSAMTDSMHCLVEKRYPFELLSRSSTHTEPPTPKVSDLFNAISDGYDMATDAHTNFGNESTWSGVVITILRNALEISAQKQPDALLEILMAQSAPIGPATLLPPVLDKVPFRKVDYLVAFSTENESVGTLIDAVHRRRPGLLLSPTENPTVGRMCQLLPVEVKSPDGTYYSSSVQLMTWLAASFEKMRELHELVAAESGAIDAPGSPLPFLGISVVGHNWHLHVAAQAENRNVTVYGPINMGDTLSFDGIFRIFNVLARIEQWGRDVYWPWLRDTILTPLAGPGFGGND